MAAAAVVAALLQEDIEVLDKFATYEDYLTSWITEEDRFYLGSEETARRIIELGYLRRGSRAGHLWGNGQLLKREEFDGRKAALREHRAELARAAPKPLLSVGRDLSGSPLLQALAQREAAVRKGTLATIVFVRGRNARGQEVSGFIDLGHRLATDEAGMEEVFGGRRRLAPQPTVDLSVFNWTTGSLSSAPSQGFELVADLRAGLAFKSRRDHKLVVVDPGAPPGDYSTRVELDPGGEYAEAVLFDHVMGRRA
eukprot:scaffold14.g1087.t1